MMKTLRLLFLISVIVSANFAFGAQLILKDGSIIEGKIAGEAVVIEGGDGQLQFVPKEKIEKIVEDTPPAGATASVPVKPELVIQSSHGDYALAVAFSPDGTLFASGGRDGVAKIWNTATGELIRNLTGHANNVNRVEFSPDGHLLATASADGSVRLWNVQTGEQAGIDADRKGSANAVVFSPDGKLLASIYTGQSIKLWDIQSGKTIRILRSTEDVSNTLDLSPDGKYVAAGGITGGVPVWDASTGELLQTLPGHGEFVDSVAFSPDGKTLAATTSDNKVLIWDTTAWRLKQTLSGFSASVNRLAFSKDGRMLATSSGEPSILLWTTDNWKSRPLLGMMPFKAYALAFSPNGKILASAHINRSVYLWNTFRRMQIREMRTYTYGVISTAFSPDGKTLAFTSDYKRIRLWNLETGEPSRILNGHTDMVTSVAFSPDGKTLASCAVDSTVHLWNTSTGADIHLMESHTGSVNSVDFSPDGKSVVSAGDDGKFVIWNVSDGSPLLSINTNEQGLKRAVFSPDGKTIASGGKGRIVSLWNASDGKLLRQLSGHNEDILCISFSKDGKSLYSAGKDGRILMFSVGTGVTLADSASAGGSIFSMALSPDGSRLATADRFLTATFWNASTLMPERTLTGHTSLVVAAAFSPDGRLLATGSDDNTLKLWNAGTGEMLATIVSLDFTMSVSMSYLKMSDNWFVTDTAGRFDCSGCVRGDAQSGKRYIRWRVGNTLYEPDQFFDIFFEPGLLSDIVKMGSVPQIKGIESVLNNLPPEVKIIWPLKNVSTRNQDTKVKVEVHDTGGGIENVRLMSHGRPTGGKPADITPHGFPPEKKLFEFDVQLVAGENRLTALATSRSGVDSRGHEIIVTSETETSRRPELFLLTIGVNEYVNSDFNLRLAVPDADAFADAISKGGASLYSQIIEKRLRNTDATRDMLGGALDEIVQQAQPSDVVVVYIAGHGIIAGGGWFFLTHEIAKTDTQYIRDNAFSEREMKAFLKKLSARKVVLVIDACQSGGMAMNMDRGLEKERILSELARSTGTFILAASTDAQAAIEALDLGHGVFTYVLLEGLSGKADVNNSGTIEIKELEIYANDKVPEYTEKYYGRRQDPFIWEVAGGGGIGGFGPTLVSLK